MKDESFLAMAEPSPAETAPVGTVRARVGKPRARRNSAVAVRMFDPGTGWGLDEARQLVLDGYTPDHVSRRTGYPVAMLLARPRPPRD